MEVIRKSVLLRCPPEKAFHLFTARVSEWWPETHRMTSDPHSELFLEESGRFWVRTGSRLEIELGRVVAWEPPHRLLLDFYLGTSETKPTAVEVTFRAEDDGTRVTVHHSPKPESLDVWKQRAPLFEQSWETVLPKLARW